MSRTTLALKPFDHEKAAKNRTAWIAIASRVLKGEFGKIDASTKQSLCIGLRGYPDDVCRRAHEMIKNL